MALYQMERTANLFRYDLTIKLYIGADTESPPYVVRKSELVDASSYFRTALAPIHYDSEDPPVIFTSPEGDKLGWQIFFAWLSSHRIPFIDSTSDEAKKYYRALLHAYQVSKDLEADGFRDEIIRAFSVSSVECDVPTVVAEEILKVTPPGDTLRQLVVHRLAVACVRDGGWKCYAWMGAYEDAFVQLLEETRALSSNYDDAPPPNCTLHDLDPTNRDDTPFSSWALEDLDLTKRDATPASVCSLDDLDPAFLLDLQ